MNKTTYTKAQAIIEICGAIKDMDCNQLDFRNYMHRTAAQLDCACAYLRATRPVQQQAINLLQQALGELYASNNGRGITKKRLQYLLDCSLLYLIAPQKYPNL